MAGLRTIRNRIRTVSSTEKITKAMKMVAAARFRRAQQRVTEARPYAQKIQELMNTLVGDGTDVRHPLFVKREGSRRILVVLTSDRGLCGAFNANILRLAREEINNQAPEKIISLGKKGTAYFTRHFSKQTKPVEEYWGSFGYAKSQGLIQELAQKYVNGEIDRVDVLYNEFQSVISQKPVKTTLLPFSSAATEEVPSSDMIFEPNEKDIVEVLIPRALEVQFFLTCLNPLASEFGSRMTAMDSASRNAEDMISKLTLKMNRARQAGITTELMEIIGGAEALSEA